MAISSRSELCSLASIKYLGAGNVVDIDTDKTNLAVACREVLPSLTSQLLREYTWSFATKRKSLAKASTAPEFGWSCQHVLPADFERLNSIENYQGKFEVEGQYIMSNCTTNIELIYTSNDIDVTRYDSLFVSLLAAELADAVGLQVRGDGFKSSRGDKLMTDLEKLHKTARLVDAQDSRKQDKFQFNRYHDARRVYQKSSRYIDV